MAVTTIVRTRIVEKLPAKMQRLIERQYLYYFAPGYLRSELRLTKRLCIRDKTSLDIGANRGDFTLFLSRFSSFVYCFEPLPTLADFLKQKFRGSNVVVKNFALGAVEEEQFLSIPCTGHEKLTGRSSLVADFENKTIRGKKVSAVDRVEVSVKSLDAFQISNIGFIKIDVEGFEFEVLQGAEATIKKNMPNMLIEIDQWHQKDHHIGDIFEYLAGLSYWGYFLYDDELKNITEFDPSEMQRPENEETPLYVNNFIFSPRPL